MSTLSQIDEKNSHILAQVANVTIRLYTDHEENNNLSLTE